MALNNLQNNVSTSSASLTSRSLASNTNIQPLQSKGTGFGTTLQAVGTLTPTTSQAPTQTDSIPFASFIDHIDFSKFKSDPQHFGQFIPVDSEASVPTIESTTVAIPLESAKSPETSYDSLLGSIDAQLNYIKPQEAIDPAQVPVGTVDVETTKNTMVATAQVEQPPATILETQSTAELTTQQLQSTDLTQAYNAGEMLIDVLSEKSDTVNKI